MRIRESDAERFWSKVKKGADNDCWLWLASVKRGDYGQFWIDGGLQQSHRVSFFMDRKWLPEEPFIVMHDCENARCVNPRHLLPGTQKENMNYPERHKRLARSLVAWRANNPEAAARHDVAARTAQQRKFMTDERKRIRAEIIEARERGVPQRVLVQKYGICQTMVSAIGRGAAWRD